MFSAFCAEIFWCVRCKLFHVFELELLLKIKGCLELFIYTFAASERILNRTRAARNCTKNHDAYYRLTYFHLKRSGILPHQMRKLIRYFVLRCFYSKINLCRHWKPMVKRDGMNTFTCWIQQESACQGAEQGPQEQVMKGQGEHRSLRRIEKQDWIDSVYGQTI